MSWLLSSCFESMLYPVLSDVLLACLYYNVNKVNVMCPLEVKFVYIEFTYTSHTLF